MRTNLLRYRFGGSAVVEIINHDVGTLTGTGQRNGFADALLRSGDQGNFAG
jgi:hypothetical protein